MRKTLRCDSSEFLWPRDQVQDSGPIGLNRHDLTGVTYRSGPTSEAAGGRICSIPGLQLATQASQPSSPSVLVVKAGRPALALVLGTE